jgi:serine/threonine protein kinase
VPVDPAVAKAVFLEAVALEDLAARGALVDARCGEDAELFARVHALLDANDRALAGAGTASLGGDADAGAAAPTADYPGRDERAGTVVGEKYALVEPIGEGGMGTVWRAKQTEPVKRFVAVKLVKVGMDSKQVLARFDAERQALALMDHPNIATVLDGGLHEGRPFFVMELVKGVPITEFCDARKLTPRARLELFVPVCLAIQHAHQKGVIHRDIKPSNVLVALYDDKPVVKVIDFGVAKATGAALTERTIDTGFGGVVGTPQYMSPEQATFNNLDIDTRSDVYALGVLLYELLAGSPPFARKDLEKRGLLEILRVVREEEPPRPSTKLSTAEALPSLSANRGTEPKKLTGLLRNELDWIVMKALEKDRTRRYESATALAADVERHLTGDAVEACPPTLGYRLRKAYRRNRAAVLVALAFACLMSGATALGVYLAVQAKRAEVTAEQNAQAFFGAMVKADDALQQLELTALSQQIDADLAAVNKYPRPHTGLLRLARTLKTLAPQTHRPYPLEGGGEIVLSARPDFLAKQQSLREFLTVAILAAGQEYGSLLPPITHDGTKITDLEISSDGQFLVTLGADRSAKLWDVRTSRRLAVLRADTEAVVRFGFSPDGRTAFTDDSHYTVRLWDVPSGRFRTRTETTGSHLPKTDTVYRHVTPGDGRVLTSTRHHDWGIGSPEAVDGDGVKTRGAVELWDTVTGRRIARLDRPRVDADRFALLGRRWVSAAEGSTVVVYSAENGQEVARLEGPVGVPTREAFSSPDGSWVVTTYGNWSFRAWRTDTWHAGPALSLGNWAAEGVLDDGTVLLSDWRDRHTCSVYRPGHADPVVAHQGSWAGVPNQGKLVLLHDGRIVDTATRQLVPTPVAGEPDRALSRFAPDGRFALHVGTDTATGKRLPITENWWPHLSIKHDRYWRHAVAVGYVSRFGQVAFALNDRDRAEPRLIPPPDRLALPAEQLELWLQVALRGELGPGDEYVKWDEPTWEQKRRQLAATPQPYPDVPFPGDLATDKLHWLRAEYYGDWIRNGVERTVGRDTLARLAAELLRRSEIERNPSEVARWSQIAAAYRTEVAPTPRPVK